MELVKIDSEFITLGQLLKLLNIIDTGGQAKFFLQENDIWVNGEKENRRGRKLYASDRIRIQHNGEYQIISK
ncbi:S4 domain-containing protein YaaA [Tepidibacillus fermentans]|uniref:S4 domain protein YaaA n=1 Tax=Tepidibacillus fermentans TaxID=1281767 RepID=A0A4R3KC82_9BACI|nr:S4 domain-containing protein YaaA [Tepidibacillus fermentans]TCS80826.1 S4 domain protein YaaA [Tepidibacillus fermentans]